MFEVTATTRAADTPAGTVTKIVAHHGGYLTDRAAAEAAAAELNRARPATCDGRAVTYAIRRRYLPACADHDEADGGCGSCEDEVEAWLDELRAAHRHAAAAEWEQTKRYARPDRRQGSLAG